MAQQLEDISGLGDTMAGRLREAGVESLDELASADATELEPGIENASAERLQGWINEAQRAGVIVQTGDQVVQTYADVPKVPTGIDDLDDLLDGGWESGYLVAVGGPTGSGKTQLSFQALGQAVQHRDAPAIYVETERGRYRGKRIIEMFDEDTQKDVYKIPAYDLEQQEAAYGRILDEFDAGSISAVVVDSFTARFRMSDRFTGREDLPDRHTVMSRHLDQLDQIAASCNVPILLTCQISGNPDQYGPKHTIYGGTFMHHMVNFVIMMEDKKGALTDLEIRNHPAVSDQELALQITETGVDVPE